MPRRRRTALPLYRYLGGDGATLLPLPQIQIFGGGAHAGRRVDIQDFMVMCPGAGSFAQALEWTAEVYRHAGAADAVARRDCRRGRRRRLVAGLRHQRGGAGDAGRARSSAPASCPASRWRSRSTSRPATSAAAAATAGPGAARARQRRPDRAAAALVRALPDRQHRGPAGRGRPAGLRALHARRGRPAAGGRRRLPGVATPRCCARPPPPAPPTPCCSSPTSAAR